MPHVSRLCAAFAVAFLPVAGQAATATGSLAVSATVIDACSVSATPLAFGNLSSTTTTTEVAPAVVSIVCTAPKPAVTVDLGGGQNPTGGVRQMSFAGERIPYSVYTDVGHANAVAVSGQIFSGSVLAVVPTTFNLYGSVAAGNYSAGAYSDLVTITVNY